MMKNKFHILVLILLLIILYTPVIIANDFIGHVEESVVNVYDSEGSFIFATAMGVTKGDRYINEDNFEFVVEDVNGNRAIAKKLGKVELLENLDKQVGLLPPLAQGGKKLIGIYFTHNDESYKPGEENVQGRGEIHNVGEVLKNALEEKGIRVIKAEDLHLPHDGAAYERSRSTSINIARQRPDAIFDVHRDAVPSTKYYVTKVEGKHMSKIRLVVGRQNPNRKVNDSFARQLKAVADKYYPGLIRGIFYGNGSYNQEVSPRSLLLEFGTHVTTKEQAQASATLFADVVNQLLYGGKGNQPSQGTKSMENTSSITTIFWIIFILGAGVLGYLFINEGSWSGVLNRIKKFFGREILDKGDK